MPRVVVGLLLLLTETAIRQLQRAKKRREPSRKNMRDICMKEVDIGSNDRGLEDSVPFAPPNHNDAQN